MARMEVDKPVLKQENVKELMDGHFLKMYDFSYFPSKHYYVASRREKEALIALKTAEEFQKTLPDAVSLVVVIKCEGREPLLCLTKEMRYPTGQFLLGVPAGLLDPEDAQEPEPVFCAAKRELWEETGIAWTSRDEIKMINPLLFSSPGMTDESNALVLVTLYREELPSFTQDGALGGECFEDYLLLNKEEAMNVLKNGVDGEGLFYSVYTWMALTTFVSGLWN